MEITETKEAISLDSIRTDGGTQARAGLNEDKVAEYQQMIEEVKANIHPGWPFKDAIELFYDGSDYWLADGFHRIEACRRAVWLWRIKANIHQGTRRDAVLFACGANADHGLPRSADDKRRAVETLLRDPEWGAWSDREIARRCKVSHPFVAKVRSEIDTGNVSSMNERVFVHPKTGKETTMNTGNIGGDNTDYSAAYDWLATYTGKHGRTWRDLEDNQVHHANSPCYQAFVAEFPNLTDPKSYLKRALARLRQEHENAVIASNNEEFWKRYDQEVQRHREDVADPDGRRPPSKCPRCHADKSSLLIGSDHWRCKNCGREYDHAGKMPVTEEVEETAVESTYTAEIEQYVEAVDAAAKEPKYLAIWELESAIRGWLTSYFGSNIKQQHQAVTHIKEDKNRAFLQLLERHILYVSYASTEPKPVYRAGDLRQAINNTCEQLRQQLAEREANTATLSRLDALWEVRLYLQDVDKELVRLTEKYPDIELIGDVVTAVSSSIGLSVIELKRAIKNGGELADEEE